MVSVNYLVVAAVLAIYYLSRGTLDLTGPVLKVGILTGCAFIIAMLVMTWALEIADVGAVLTAFRLAILVPIATSVWIWEEKLTPTQLVGIVLAVISLVLMTRGKNHHAKLSGGGSLALVLLIFFLQGVSHACIGWVHYAGLDAQRMHVLLVVAATAGILGSILIVFRRHRPRRQDVRMGTGIGLYNLAALGVVLTTLSLVPGTIFFALQGCAVVIMDNFFAHFIWKEPLNWPAKIGAGIGALSMLLVL